MTEIEDGETHHVDKEAWGSPQVYWQRLPSISRELGREFSMRHQERLAGIPDDMAWAGLREYNRYWLGE